MTSAVQHILELSRWAPSGDNTQPWKFELIDDGHVVLHGIDTREDCVYDLDGHPSQISLGALLETAAIAASAHGLRLDVQRRLQMPVPGETTQMRERREIHTTFDLRFERDERVSPDALISSIERRSVQRRAMSTRALTSSEKAAFEASVGPQHQVVWIEGFGRRLQTARLMFNSAHLRLTMREAYEVHRKVIEWNARFSKDRVPDQALGVDAMTTRLMRFVMHDWQRVQFFNAFLAGTWAPRFQMDFLPGIACGAHFVLLANEPPASIDDYVAGGRAVQRFWLTATHLGLGLQPEVTPVIFSRYFREQRVFSDRPGAMRAAENINGKLAELIGADNTRLAVFMGRVGAGAPPKARSIRKDFDELVQRA